VPRHIAKEQEIESPAQKVAPPGFHGEPESEGETPCPPEDNMVSVKDEDSDGVLSTIQEIEDKGGSLGSSAENLDKSLSDNPYIPKENDQQPPANAG